MYLFVSALGLGRFSSIVSALAFMFSSFFIDEVWWGHETVLGSIIWTPLIFLFYLKAINKRKTVYGVLAGVFLAVQLFSGHFQFAYYGMLALSVFALYFFLSSVKKKEFGKACQPLLIYLVVAVIGLGLVAILFFPAAELSEHSIRSFSGDAFAFFTRWSMEPKYMITFLFPRLAPVIGLNSFPFSIALGYIGILSALLVAASLFLIKDRFVLFFWILCCLSILLTLGRYTPVYSLLYRFLPGFSLFRNPIFFLYLYVFSASVLAGYGSLFLKNKIWKLRERNMKILIGSLICAGLGLIIIASVVSINIPTDVPEKSSLAAGVNSKTLKFREAFVYDLVNLGCILLLISVPLLLRKRLQTRNLFLQTTIVCLIFLDLFVYGKNFIQTYDLTPFVSKGKWVEFLNRETQPYRVLPLLDYPEQDPVLKLNKISSINGYGSLEILQDYVDFIAAFQTSPVTQDASLMRVSNHDSVAVDMLNVKYILTSQNIEDERFPLVYTDEIPAAKTWDPYREDTLKLNIYENKSFLPRAFIVRSIRVVKGREKILEAMKAPGFDPRKTLLLDESPAESSWNLGLGEETDQISYLSYEEDEIILNVSLEKSGFLVLSEIYYPGWKAFVDGRESKIYRANYLFRSLHLTKGEHTIKFVFSPISFKIGASMTLSTLLILFSFFIFFILRRKRISEST